MSAEQGVTEVYVEQPAQSGNDGEDFGGSGGYELDADGQRVPHGMGVSKSSRRRRRKRKGKTAGPEGSAQAAAPAGGQPSGEFAPANGNVAPAIQAGDAQPAQNGSQPVAQPGNGQPGGQFRQQRSFGGQQQNGQNGQNSAAGTKRWKKKFRDRDRPRSNDNPGNQSFAQNGGQNGGSQPQNGGQNGGSQFRGPDTHQPGNGGGFKRKGGFGGGGGKQQQRGPRSFVGPMDHSYRVVNGNVFDGASTTEISNGGGRGRSHTGDSQPIDYSQGRAIPIPPDAPTRIYFFIEDLFFTAKIQETARKLGVKVAFIKNDKEQLAALTDADEADRPGLIVIDLNNANAKPMTLIPKLKTKLKKTTSIVGFLSHLQGDLKAKAIEVGCDTVMPRAAFSQNLPNLLRRYGVEEVDEPNYNQ